MFLTQLKDCHWNILVMLCLNFFLSYFFRSNTKLFQRQTLFYWMQQTKTTSFYICLSGRLPSTHRDILSSTIATTPLAVEMSLFLTVHMQLLFYKPDSFLILSYNLSLCCSVAKAWSILVIPIKAISFFSFIFLSNLIFYLIMFFRLMIAHILNILWLSISFELALQQAIQLINLSTYVPNTVTPSIYLNASYFRFEITSQMTAVITQFCLMRCSILYRKMSLPN